MTSLGLDGVILYDSCLGSCQANFDTYKTYQEYLCKNYQPIELVTYYGINPCGLDTSSFPPPEPPVVDEKKDTDTDNNKYYIFAAVVLLCLGLLLIFKKE